MSKGLEAFERLRKNIFPYFGTLYDKEWFEEDIQVITNELKALEIIIEKQVDISYLYWRIKWDKLHNMNITLKTYNETYEERKLTIEEFNILKETLCKLMK